MSLLSLASFAVLALGSPSVVAQASPADPASPEAADPAETTAPAKATDEDNAASPEATDNSTTASPEATDDDTAASPEATESDTTTPSEVTPAEPWIRRNAPPRSSIEAGMFTGLLVPSRRIELFEADFDLPDQGYKPLARPVPAFGIRTGYYPLHVFGVEAEGSVMPGRTEALDERVLLWSVRGNLVGQVGLWSVTPFVLVGGGLIGVASHRSKLGNDADVAMHFGGGAKINVTQLLQVRLDVRDIITARRGYNAGVVNNLEALLGLSVTLGR